MVFRVTIGLVLACFMLCSFRYIVGVVESLGLGVCRTLLISGLVPCLDTQDVLNSSSHRFGNPQGPDIFCFGLGTDGNVAAV